MTWQFWQYNPPPRDQTVVLARLPDRVIRYEPIPHDVVVARDLPPWFNVAGLLWKPSFDSQAESG